MKQRQFSTIMKWGGKNSSPEISAEQKRREKRMARFYAGKLKKSGVTALCLGGGGTRGFAHIGAIKAFEENGIDFDIIVGTSAGSIIGCLYAYGISAQRMLEYGAALNEKDIHNGNFLVPNDAGKIGRIVSDFIGDATIEQVKAARGKKFACVAVDLVTTKQIVLSSGRAATAVSASSCVPLLYKPVVLGELHLVDGGVLNNIPSDVCRLLGADKVVTIDVNPTRSSGTDKTNFISVFKAVFAMMGANSSINGIIDSDVLVSTDTSEFSSGKKEGFAEMYRRGYLSAKEKIPDIVDIMYK